MMLPDQIEVLVAVAIKILFFDKVSEFFKHVGCPKPYNENMQLNTNKKFFKIDKIY